MRRSVLRKRSLESYWIAAVSCIAGSAAAGETSQICLEIFQPLSVFAPAAAGSLEENTAAVQRRLLSFAPMWRFEILCGTDGHDAGRIDVFVRDVVVALDVIQIHGIRNARLLIQVEQITM